MDQPAFFPQAGHNSWVEEKKAKDPSIAVKEAEWTRVLAEVGLEEFAHLFANAHLFKKDTVVVNPEEFFSFDRRTPEMKKLAQDFRNQEHAFYLEFYRNNMHRMNFKMIAGCLALHEGGDIPVEIIERLKMLIKEK